MTIDARFISIPCRAWLPGLRHTVDGFLTRTIRTGHIHLEIEWQENVWASREIEESAPSGQRAQRLQAVNGFVYYVDRAAWLAIQPPIVDFSGTLERVA